MVPRLPDLSGSIPSAEDVTRNPHLTGIEIPAVTSWVKVIVGMPSLNLHVFSEIRQEGESRLWATIQVNPHLGGTAWPIFCHFQEFTTFYEFVN